MATMEELYQQYLLTQPGVGGSQNRYRDLMSQTKPFVSPYPASRGLLAGAAVKPPSTTTGSSMGTYGGGLGGTTVDGVDQNLSTANPSWDALTDAEKASFYANNSGFAKATQIGQSIFGNTSLGKLQGLFAPGFVANQGLIPMGVDPAAYQKAKESFRTSEINAMNQAAAAMANQTNVPTQQESKDAFDAYMAANATNVPTEQEAKNAFEAYMAPPALDPQKDAAASFAGALAYLQAAAQQAANDSAAQAAQTSYESGIGNPGESIGFTSSESGIGNPGEFSYTSYESGIGNPGESYNDSSGYGGGYDSGGYGTGDSSGFGGGTDSGGDGYAKGGKVIKAHLKGPNPKGPDEGYGALLGGEFVIKKSAVKKYGEGLLSMINDGKIPAKKLKSLL